ncbi:hypothetical protein ACWCO3_19815, partial [Micromonospora sp. NPDC002411]
MRRIDVRLAAGLSVLALVAGCGGQQGGADTDDTASEVTCEVTKETRVGIATGTQHEYDSAGLFLGTHMFLPSEARSAGVVPPTS